jgi:hypothetical protein
MSDDIEFSLVLCGMLLMMGAVMIWLGWIRDYIRHQGERPSFVLFSWSPITDYRKAHRISRLVGHTPWFLRAFEALLATAVSIGILLMLSLILSP